MKTDQDFPDLNAPLTDEEWQEDLKNPELRAKVNVVAAQIMLESGGKISLKDLPALRDLTRRLFDAAYDQVEAALKKEQDEH